MIVPHWNHCKLPRANPQFGASGITFRGLWPWVFRCVSLLVVSLALFGTGIAYASPILQLQKPIIEILPSESFIGFTHEELVIEVRVINTPANPDLEVRVVTTTSAGEFTDSAHCSVAKRTCTTNFLTLRTNDDIFVVVKLIPDVAGDHEITVSILYRTKNGELQGQHGESRTLKVIEDPQDPEVCPASATTPGLLPEDRNANSRWVGFTRRIGGITAPFWLIAPVLFAGILTRMWFTLHPPDPRKPESKAYRDLARQYMAFILILFGIVTIFGWENHKDISAENSPDPGLELTFVEAIPRNGYILVKGIIQNFNDHAVPWRSDWLRTDVNLDDGQGRHFDLNGVASNFGRSFNFKPGESVVGFWFFRPDDEACKEGKISLDSLLPLELDHPRFPSVDPLPVRVPQDSG